MKRILVLAAALPAGVLLQMPTAHATPLCEDVSVSGIVNVNPSPACVPSPFDPTCLDGPVGQPGTLYVTYDLCGPSVFGQGGEPSGS